MRKSCRAPGIAAYRNIERQCAGSLASGKPAMTATRMPTQMPNWLSHPSVPRTFSGEISAMYIGTRLLDAPMPRPHRSRPRSIIATFGANEHMTEPTTRGTATAEGRFPPEHVRQLPGEERPESGTHEDGAHDCTHDLNVRGDAEVAREVLERGVDDAQVVPERKSAQRGDENGGQDATHDALLVRTRGRDVLGTPGGGLKVR